MVESERRANRSCAIGATWTALVLLILSIVVGLTDQYPQVYPCGVWQYFAVTAILILGIVAYAKWRDFRGEGVKHLMIISATLIPLGLVIPSAYGFFLLALPLVVSARYFSRKFVWQTYAMCASLTVLVTLPHAYFAVPLMELSPETMPVLQKYVAGSYDWSEYFLHIVTWHVPAFIIGLGFFAITLSRHCHEHFEALEQQASVNARLVDVEKGLFFAAASATMSAHVVSAGESPADSAARQPDVGDWSTEAISACIAKCKRRAAEDPAFAVLIERDPAAAVKEVGV